MFYKKNDYRLLSVFFFLLAGLIAFSYTQEIEPIEPDSIDWDSGRGYPVVDFSTRDTLMWVDDSLRMVEVADSLRGLSFFVSIKKGDSNIPRHHKAGDIICWHDGGMVKEPEKFFSEYHRSVYAVIRLPKATWRDSIIDGVRPNCDTLYKLADRDYRPAKRRFDLTALGLDTAKSVKEFTPTPIIDGSAIEKTTLKSSAVFANAAAVDLKTINSGTYTFGPGGDYASLKAAIDDIDSVDTAGDSIFLKCLAHSPENSAITLDFKLNGGKLIIGSNSPHNGNPANALCLVDSVATNHLLTLNLVNNGIVEIKDICMHRGQPKSSAANTFFTTYNSTAVCSLRMHDLYVNGMGRVGGGLSVSDDQPVTKAWNIAIYGLAGGTNSIAWFHYAASASDTLSNVTISNCIWGFNCNSVAPVLINCIANACSLGGGRNLSNAKGYNNASSDTTLEDADWGTGSGNKTGIVAANEFVSTTNTSPYFLKLKAGGVCDTAGLAYRKGGLGIRNNASPGADNKYSIGADEYWIATYDTTYSDSLTCGVVVYQDSGTVDSLNWIDTTRTGGFFRILAVCASNAARGMYNRLMYQKRIYQNPPYNNGVVAGRKDEW